MAIARPVEGTLFRTEGLPPKERLPTQYDLPSEDPEEPGLPDEFHVYQPQLLRETFRPNTYDPLEVFIGTDINLYYDLDHPLWHKRPDWFAVLGRPRAQRVEELRFSYVIWQEEIAPYLVVELLSPGTEDEDLGRRLWDLDKTPAKWVVYEQILKIPYYVTYSRQTGELRAFGRVSSHYRPIDLTDDGLWLPEAGIGLGIWEGPFEGYAGRWLRCFDSARQWLPTVAEQRDLERQHADQERQRAEQERQRADQECQRADQERMRAEQERQRAERLAQRLRALGMDPDSLDEGPSG
jgi:Uma2 family endonuclease